MTYCKGHTARLEPCQVGVCGDQFTDRAQQVGTCVLLQMREEDQQLSDQGQAADEQQGQGFTLLITPALSRSPFHPSGSWPNQSQRKEATSQK